MEKLYDNTQYKVAPIYHLNLQKLFYIYNIYLMTLVLPVLIHE